MYYSRKKRASDKYQDHNVFHTLITRKLMFDFFSRFVFTLILRMMFNEHCSVNSTSTTFPTKIIIRYIRHTQKYNTPKTTWFDKAFQAHLHSTLSWKLLDKNRCGEWPLHYARKWSGFHDCNRKPYLIY